MIYKKQIENAQKLLDGISIPSMPESVIKLQKLFLESEFPEPEKIKKLLSVNPYLAGELVSLANTPIINNGLTTPIKDIDAAIFRLGNRYVKNYVMAIAIKQFMETRKIASLCYHSQVIAIYCSTIARYSDKVRQDEAYLVGLLHDIGTFALAEVDQVYGQVFINTLNKHYTLEKDEFSKYATTHTAVGYVIANQWNLPNSLAQTVLLHHSKVIDDIHNEKLLALIATVKLAHSLSIKYMNKQKQTKETQAAYDAGLEVLEFSEDIVKQIDSQAEKAIEFLK